MKVKSDQKILIPVLLFVNIFLFAAVILIHAGINKISTQTISGLDDTYSIPYLPRQVSDQIKVGSRAYIIYDSKSRAAIIGKNEKLRFAPASSVKIMTAIIALEYYDPEQVLTAENLNVVEGSKMKLVEGEKITVINLLYGLMLPSGNDAAYVLAQNFPGGMEAYVKKMNEKAKELDLQNTKFIDPAGYDDNNYTTAYDLARLGAYALKNPQLAKIVSTKSISVTDVSGQIIHQLVNLNELLGIEGITGIKTGFTDEAGGVLVTSYGRGDRTYIIVVLNSSDRFADTKNVIQEAILRITGRFIKTKLN